MPACHAFTTDFEGKISARTSNESHSVLVDFVQKYYTIAYQTPTSYEGFFAEGVTGKDLAPYVGPDNPPVFIKSVTYGRRYYLMITSTASSTEIEASIRASYDAATFGADLDVDATYVGELEDVQISVFAMGGDAQKAAATFGGDFNAVQDFLTEGGSIETGVPLSYKMETVAEPHQDVGIGLATNFSINNCQPAGLPDFAKGWFGIFDGEGISAAVVTQANGDDVLLFNQEGTRYAEVRSGQLLEINTLGDPNDQGRLAGCPIDTAGAAQGLNGQIRIFSKDGLKYVWQSQLQWGDIRDLYQWGNDGTHPFLEANAGGEAGIGAAFQSKADPAVHSIHFNRAGNRWVSAINEGFSSLRSLDDWGGTGFDIPFAGIGAGARVFYKGAHREILFNKEGTHFFIFRDPVAPGKVYQIGNDPD
ncbi:MAG: thiol-activated cytolysin family protein [Bacteroidota bacterium]